MLVATDAGCTFCRAVLCAAACWSASHAQFAKQAANRWQDNVVALQSWCKRKFEGREGEVDTFFRDQVTAAATTARMQSWLPGGSHPC